IAGGQERQQEEHHQGGRGQRGQGGSHPCRTRSLPRGAEDPGAQVGGRRGAGRVGGQAAAEALVGEVGQVGYWLRGSGRRVRRRASARKILDFTVPTGHRMTRATSSSGRPSTSASRSTDRNSSGSRCIARSKSVCVSRTAPLSSGASWNIGISQSGTPSSATADSRSRSRLNVRNVFLRI